MNITISCGPLAQLVEQFPFKEWVVGSSPTRLTTNHWVGKLIFQKLVIQNIDVVKLESK